MTSGPLPNPNAIRRNKHNSKVIQITPTGQPELPRTYRHEGKRVVYPTETRDWWDHWGETALSDEFTNVDWDNLRIAAILHAHIVTGDLVQVQKFMQIISKYGATPEDKARLRISTSNADKVDRPVNTVKLGTVRLA